MKLIIKKYPVSAFFVFTFLWTDGIWCLMLPSVQQALNIHINPLWAWLGLIGPGLFAVVISVLIGGLDELKLLLRPFLKWRTKLYNYILIYLGVFFFYCGASWFSLIISPDLEIPDWGSLIASTKAPISGLTGIGMLVEVTLIYSLCEELGWRGFALPKMTTKMHCITALLIISIIWTFWHVPLVYLNGAAFSLDSFVFYYLHILCMTLIYGWLYFKTDGSLLLAGLMHGTTNGIGGLFPLTSSTIGQGANGPTLFMEITVAMLMLPYLWRCEYGKRCQVLTHW